MRIFVIALSAFVLAGPVAALHADNNPPGQIAKNNPDDIGDRNGNGKANGGDYSPGYSASVGDDENGDGKTNGKDYAPGQGK